MAHRIEISSRILDARAHVLKEKLGRLGIRNIDDLSIIDVYTIDADFDGGKLEQIASMLTNPVTQKSNINKPQSPQKFDFAIEIGFLPGVTDNVANTTKQGIEDLFKQKLKSGDEVYTSQIVFLTGTLDKDEIERIVSSLHNPLIQRIINKTNTQFIKDGGMGIGVPKVKLIDVPVADIVPIIDASDEELAIIGKNGIQNKDKNGSRRGPLALDLSYMKTIQSYFKKRERNPTDIELESIAQTWSEHCKHTIFADPIDEVKNGLYKTYIKEATKKIRADKGKDDFCVSVFTDNSGAIVFDDEYLITDKAETHNSPSALDPFGGSITGIVGVNRDTIGFGLGAKPVINMYGFCFADPNDNSPLYKGKSFTQKMLPPRMIMEGVINGVNAGGNQSGIPTPQGFVVFDERYKGKPLVFVGTVGLIPKHINGKSSHTKQARKDDYIVMVGGRVGKDGIHGATFSSEAMDAGSPATAVQIGDPITQKKLSDAIIKEARDRGLYNSITDNGAGGISCSVAEMAKECGGCRVKLDTVPLKYPGLSLWETWISESQERMTMAIPKDKWLEFSDLMKRRGVEATVIGEFNDSGKCVVEYNDKKIMDIDMDFLHDGLPPRPMKTTYTKQKYEEPEIPVPHDLTQSLFLMLARLNIASHEFISKQYDHEVQAGSVIKPLHGKGRVNGDASVTRPRLDSNKGVVCSQGINPSYSDIDTYHMAACTIDTAIRNAVAAGANIEHIALMDNFCWCSSNEPERLGQLKAAVKACYDYAVSYGTPFISGKDSMFNDFNGYDEHGNKVKISVPPTLLISSIAVIDDVMKAVSLDAKFEGDLIYVIGETKDELGASEYYAMLGEERQKKRYIGNVVPVVDAKTNKKIYAAFHKAVQNEIISSAQSVHRGGLVVALAKTAIGGMLGIGIELSKLSGTWTREDFALYSETQGRIVVTIAPENKNAFEKIMHGNALANIGKVTKSSTFAVKGKDGKTIINTNISDLMKSYKSTFGGY
ncbi:phosphoribosylformylglycinamidine synthase [Candidatus Micrarchaeota archaeon]|nr:phosphoribosylformylglycinamidine synthase [Candidatus Micrarchaeota archaeon]MBU1166705.1 phosphoribosylformylglycinamidine synthase [Candidatus Micrarchaeota archaeon]MBU1886130.1 phosphoribosylformylglycinamidine synthase [Candidatus Micrarchaeota archaeon]